MTVAEQTLADRLKSETWPLHQQAEKHPYMAATMRGTISRNSYTAELQQRLILHTALEDALRAAAMQEPNIRTVLKDYHERAPHLLADLAAFNAQPGTANAVTREMVSEIESAANAAPWKLLGYLYVLEGSTNGAQYIAKALAKGFAISDGAGLSYQNPHGDSQRPRWQQFRTDIAAIPLTTQQQHDVVAAADRMFRYSIDLFESLAPTPAN